ncbi:MAG: hypothetical protein WCL16_02760 [bacterium]
MLPNLQNLLQAPPGPAGDLVRIVPALPDGFTRLCSGERLLVEATLSSSASAAVAVALLYAPVADEQDWHVEPLARAGNVWSVRIAFPQRGPWLARLVYTRDGQLWQTERADWITVLVDPPSVDNLRVYTMIPRFSGPYSAWPGWFEKAAAMGFNAIHILPVTPSAYSHSPYAPSEHENAEPLYCDPADPRPALAQWEDVAAAAGRLGLRLIVDLVLNHVGVGGRVATNHPEWLTPDGNEADGIMRSGWSDNRTRHVWRDLALLRYDHPHPALRQTLWEHMASYARFWSRYAAATNGLIRLDNLHGSDPAFVAWLLAHLRHEFPGVGLWAEMFSTHDVIVRCVPEYGIDLLLATSWEHHFVPPLRAFLQHLRAHSPALRHLSPVLSHDSGGIAQEFGGISATLPRYVLAALFTDGRTGLVQGVETGMTQHPGFIGPPCCPPPDFGGSDFRAPITKINRLLDREAIFRAPATLRFVDDNHDAIIAAVRTDALGTPRYLMLCNFDGLHPQILTVDTQRHALALAAQTATDELTGTTVTLTPPLLRLTLAPCQALVLRLAAKP